MAQTTNTDTRTLRARLRDARVNMRDPRLTGENLHYSSKFVPRDEVLAVCVKTLLLEGLTLTQGIRGGELVTELHDDNDTLTLGAYPVAVNSDPQKYAASCTYASRLSLMLAFALAGEPDDDGNTAAAPPAEDTTKREWEAVVKMYRKQDTKDAVMAKLGNPKSGDAALVAFKKLTAEERAALGVLAMGAK